MKGYKKRAVKSKKSGFWVLVILMTACAVTLIGNLFFLFAGNENNLSAFEEPYVVLNDGWVVTDSQGNAKEITSFPYILEYGTDGKYTVENTLYAEPGMLLSPTLEFYTNYLDISAELDGETIYSFPPDKDAYSRVTGNKWHYIRISDYDGKTIRLRLDCQLGDGITYQLNAPRLGSKATMISETVRTNMPAMILAGCTMILAVMLLSFYLILKRKLHLDYSSLYISIFSFIFAVYVFLENTYVKTAVHNGYVVYTATYMVLALVLPPLVCFFYNDVEKKYRPVVTATAALSLTNFFVQSALHFLKISDFRIMMPVTHGVIIISIVTMMILLIVSDSKECPMARKKLLSVIPVVAGGASDIVLLWINKPSFNNSLWFVVGVSIFIIVQFVYIVRSYFGMFRMAIENDSLRNMAFRDELTGLGNRNAYEGYLKMLGERTSLNGLGCIVADINRLKYINDTFGHSAGDAVIKATGEVIQEIMPRGSGCYRTGGDEFVILLNTVDKDEIESLSDSLMKKVIRNGKNLSLPLTVSAGHGIYNPDDGGVLGFIKRVDSLMYTEKETFHMKSGTMPTKIRS